MSVIGTNIAVSIRGKPILHGVDFDAQPGQIHAIVGPNGSGKTTLLRALTGEIGASGRITLNDHSFDRKRPWEMASMRGVLPQATVLSFPFTVIEVVRMGLEAGRHGASPEIAHQALREVSLEGYEGRFFQELSGGEQQRAQLARVLSQVWEPVHDGAPCWLFLDEPVASLDIGHQLGVMELARRYADRSGGVIAVMHDLNLTAMFADQVTLLSKGKVAATGDVANILTDDLLSAAYDCALRVNAAPSLGKTFFLPHTAMRS